MIVRNGLVGIGIVALLLGGCPGDPGSGESDGSSGVDPTGPQPGTSSSGAVDSTDDGVVTSTGTTAPTTGADSSSGSSDSTATTGGNPTIDCPSEMQTLACGDGIDNDRDGQIDLFDPECVGPCDDDEGSFQTGLPGDNMDCLQDCFFDGNSGHGDDGCNWNLTCDPANPGANLEPVSCDYMPGPQCDNMKIEPSPECIEFCEPYVPPGCDCFGCCTIQTPEGPIDIFLNSEPPCSLENLEACNPCTPQIELCGNPCEPELCEQCFGATDLPEGCDDVGCPGTTDCDEVSDCPTDYYCYVGCCYPPPQG